MRNGRHRNNFIKVNGFRLLLDISILSQTSEESFYFVTKRIPYLCGFWRFANAYIRFSMKGTKGYYSLAVEEKGDWGTSMPCADVEETENFR